jgi:hypothetical protein
MGVSSAGLCDANTFMNQVENPGQSADMETTPAMMSSIAIA